MIKRPTAEQTQLNGSSLDVFLPSRRYISVVVETCAVGVCQGTHSTYWHLMNLQCKEYLFLVKCIQIKFVLTSDPYFLNKILCNPNSAPNRWWLLLVILLCCWVVMHFIDRLCLLFSPPSLMGMEWTNHKTFMKVLYFAEWEGNTAFASARSI